ncbi:MAG: N-acetylmuramoyl-L-alanine amidase [Bradyrhizobium sp.]|nr:MAG: N-acetylmuramoyl-L-alanine amidase [Bradyrhizobium sp.]
MPHRHPFAALGAGLLAALVTLVAQGLAAQEVARPVAVAARIADDGETARIAFDLSGPVSADAHALVDPDRIVVDMAEVNFQIDPSVGRPTAARGDAIVKTFRFGLLGPGRSRVVVDLAKPACVASVEMTPIAKGAAASRLTIELKRCEASAFAAAAREQGSGAAAAVVATAGGPPAGAPVIVLDPGHGGVDGGAYGADGAIEKTLVYEYALELQRRLEATGRYKVAMTRHGDEFVSLDDRVRLAREAGAALLISIHADMLPGASADVAGATVYTCSERASDAEAAHFAARENAADKAAGVEAKAQAPGVADILFDLERRETRAYAHIFSRDLIGQLQGAARLNHNPERSAGFVVLKAPDFPSVLVELGYLSNAKDVQALNSPEWRGRAAGAMVEAVDRFFAPATRASASAQAKLGALATPDSSPTAAPATEPLAPPADGPAAPR